MEAITLATAFASIIGLIRVYKAERSEQNARDFGQYIDWLRRQEHLQVIDLILGNDELAQSVRDLIEDRHGEVMAKLDMLDMVLARVARHIEVFQPLSNAVRASQLSDQAVSILRQLNQASASRFLEIADLAGSEYVMLDTQGTIRITEPRFIEDDLLTLCELSFLRQGCNNDGNRVFSITREGSAVGTLDATSIVKGAAVAG